MGETKENKHILLSLRSGFKVMYWEIRWKADLWKKKCIWWGDTRNKGLHRFGVILLKKKEKNKCWLSNPRTNWIQDVTTEFNTEPKAAHLCKTRKNGCSRERRLHERLCKYVLICNIKSAFRGVGCACASSALPPPLQQQQPLCGKQVRSCQSNGRLQQEETGLNRCEQLHTAELLLITHSVSDSPPTSLSTTTWSCTDDQLQTPTASHASNSTQSTDSFRHLTRTHFVQNSTALLFICKMTSTQRQWVCTVSQQQFTKHSLNNRADWRLIKRKYPRLISTFFLSFAVLKRASNALYKCASQE